MPADKPPIEEQLRRHAVSSWSYLVVFSNDAAEIVGTIDALRERTTPPEGDRALTEALTELDGIMSSYDTSDPDEAYSAGVLHYTIEALRKAYAIPADVVDDTPVLDNVRELPNVTETADTRNHWAIPVDEMADPHRYDHLDF